MDGERIPALKARCARQMAQCEGSRESDLLSESFAFEDTADTDDNWTGKKNL